MTLEELCGGLDRLIADRECKNLMGRYFHYHTTYQHPEYLQTWAKRDDDLLLMPWGGYSSYQGVVDGYLTDDEDRFDGDPETMSWIKGNLDVHTYSSLYIEVAEDNETAIGICMSPGFTTFGNYGDPFGIWAWSKYGVDFIREDGVWKLWKMRLYPMFKAPYYQAWSESEHYQGRSDETHESMEKLPAYEYTPDGIYPDNEPPVPKPYSTYEDVGFIFE